MIHSAFRAVAPGARDIGTSGLRPQWTAPLSNATGPPTGRRSAGAGSGLELGDFLRASVRQHRSNIGRSDRRAQATAFERTWRCIGRPLASAHLTAADLRFPRRGFDPLPSSKGVESSSGERGARGDDDLGAGRPRGINTLVVPSDQRPDRQVAPPQGLDDGAAHVADPDRGARDQNRTARRQGGTLPHARAYGTAYTCAKPPSTNSSVPVM